MNRPHDPSGTATLPPAGTTRRVLVFGIRCRFTELVVSHMLAHGVNLVGAVLPGPPGTSEPLRITPPRSTLPFAADPDSILPAGLNRLPLYQVGSLTHPSTVELVESVEPDVILVACYPRVIPGRIRRLAPRGAINIHPSALPENRGPDPLFWAFRRGDGRFGVTVHELSEKLDAGDILERREFSGWHARTETDVEIALARHAGNMASRVVEKLARGHVTRIPQDETLASYQGWPTDSDYLVDTRLSAQAAFNFIVGLLDRGIPIRVAHAGRQLTVVEAISHHSGDVADINTSDPDIIAVQCGAGTLVVRIRRSGN
jgi:methionyl-tRNA formyltransferase